MDFQSCNGGKSGTMGSMSGGEHEAGASYGQYVHSANVVPLQIHHGQAARLVAQRHVLPSAHKACQYALLAPIVLLAPFLFKSGERGISSPGCNLNS